MRGVVTHQGLRLDMRQYAQVRQMKKQTHANFTIRPIPDWSPQGAAFCLAFTPNTRLRRSLPAHTTPASASFLRNIFVTTTSAAEFFAPQPLVNFSTLLHGNRPLASIFRRIVQTHFTSGKRPLGQHDRHTRYRYRRRRDGTTLRIRNSRGHPRPRCRPDARPCNGRASHVRHCAPLRAFALPNARVRHPIARSQAPAFERCGSTHSRGNGFSCAWHCLK